MFDWVRGNETAKVLSKYINQLFRGVLFNCGDRSTKKGINGSTLALICPLKSFYLLFLATTNNIMRWINEPLSTIILLTQLLQYYL